MKKKIEEMREEVAETIANEVLTNEIIPSIIKGEKKMKRTYRKQTSIIVKVMNNLRKAVNSLSKIDSSDETEEYIINAIESIEMTIQQKIAEYELFEKFKVLSEEQRESFAKRIGL